MRAAIIRTDEHFERFTEIALSFKKKGWRVIELYKYAKGKKFCMREIRLFVGEDQNVVYLPDEVGEKIRKKRRFSATFLTELFDRTEAQVKIDVCRAARKARKT